MIKPKKRYSSITGKARKYQPMYNTDITGEEAKKLGLFYRHKFSRCPNNYNGAGVYLIEFSDGWCKIGMARRVAERLNHYSPPWVKSISNIQCYKTSNPARLERLVKRKFRDWTHKNSPEYIVIPFQDIIKFIESDDFYTSIDNTY